VHPLLDRCRPTVAPRSCKCRAAPDGAGASSRVPSPLVDLADHVSFGETGGEFWQAVSNVDPLPHWADVAIPVLFQFGAEDTNVDTAAPWKGSTRSSAHASASRSTKIRATHSSSHQSEATTSSAQRLSMTSPPASPRPPPSTEATRPRASDPPWVRWWDLQRTDPHRSPAIVGAVRSPPPVAACQNHPSSSREVDTTEWPAEVAMGGPATQPRANTTASTG